MAADETWLDATKNLDIFVYGLRTAAPSPVELAHWPARQRLTASNRHYRKHDFLFIASSNVCGIEHAHAP
jgi:hypothetical protein